MKVVDLKKTYKLKNAPTVEALKGISFTVEDRGMLFFLGKSGSGKSTLLNILSGLDRADSGSIEFCGIDLCKLSIEKTDDYRNTCCGFVFQEYNLIPELNVEENISLALGLQGVKDTEEAVNTTLCKVGLEGYGKRKATELSGGQKQRVAIARAIIKEPSVIFADEPTGALDKETGESIMELLKSLSENRLVIVVSHDREFAEKYGDRIIELQDGQIVSDSGENKEKVSEKTKKDTVIPLKKSKLPFKAAFKIGSGNFKYHPVRLITTVLLSVITFGILGACLNMAFINPQERYIDAVYENRLERTSVYKMQYYDATYDGFELSRLWEGKTIRYRPVPISDGEIDGWIEKYGIRFAKVCAAEIYGFQNSVAATVEQSNEMLANDPNYHEEMKADGFMYLGKTECENLGYEVVGRLPENPEEIAINEAIFNAFKLGGIKDIQDGKIYSLSSAQDIIGRKISVNVNMFRPDVETPNSGKFGISDVKTIVGVVNTGCGRQCFGTHNTYGSTNNAVENYHSKIFVSENSFSKWSYVLCNIDYGNGNFKNFTEFAFGYDEEECVLRFSDKLTSETNMYYGNSFYSNIEFIDDDKILFLYIALIIFAAAFVLLVNFIAVSLRGQMKQIGILSSMGANFREKCKIYMSGASVISAAVTVLSVIFAAVFTVIYNENLIDFTKFDLVTFTFPSALILAIIVFAAVFTGVMIPLIGMKKLSPVKLIAKGQVK